jgi:hypothetical protein
MSDSEIRGPVPHIASLMRATGLSEREPGVKLAKKKRSGSAFKRGHG